MTVEDLFDKYKVLPNPFRGGELFETYGEQLEYVLAQPEERIWTLISEGETDFVLPGFRLVNRMGYYIVTRSNQQ